MDKQLSFKLLSGKGNSSLEKHLSSKEGLKKQTLTIKSKKRKELGRAKENEPLSPINKKKPKVEEGIKASHNARSKTKPIRVLPKSEKDFKLDDSFLSLEEASPLREASHNPKKELFFENLISVKTVAEMLGLAPKTIHNWVYLKKIPYVKCGRKVMFRLKSLKAWLNRKEAKSWL